MMTPPPIQHASHRDGQKPGRHRAARRWGAPRRKDKGNASAKGAAPQSVHYPLGRIQASRDPAYTSSARSATSVGHVPLPAEGRVESSRLGRPGPVRGGRLVGHRSRRPLWTGQRGLGTRRRASETLRRVRCSMDQASEAARDARVESRSEVEGRRMTATACVGKSASSMLESCPPRLNASAGVCALSHQNVRGNGSLAPGGDP